MISKEEAAKAANMSLAEIGENYPKATMIMDYIFKHYPDDLERIANHKMIGPMIFSDYSNSQIEGMIDKLAIFNNWKKYSPAQPADEA